MINQYQQGGTAPQQGEQQDAQAQAIQLAAQVLQQMGYQITDQNSFVQAIQDFAKKNNMQPQQALQVLVQKGQQMMTQSARLGAKLNYLKQLRGNCPEGQKLEYHKVGGKMCAKCGGSIKRAAKGSKPVSKMDGIKNSMKKNTQPWQQMVAKAKKNKSKMK